MKNLDTPTYTCFIDLDGVLANFSGKVAELMGFTLTEGDEISTHPKFEKKQMWKLIHNHDSHTPFFYSLEEMSDAHELFDFILEYFDHDDIAILSASGHTPVDAPQQKRRWVRKHFGDYTSHIVAKSPDKAAYATPTAILIDDRDKSIDPWVAAGGIGILHKNAKDTIEQLKKLLGV